MKFVWRWFCLKKETNFEEEVVYKLCLKNVLCAKKIFIIESYSFNLTLAWAL